MSRRRIPKPEASPVIPLAAGTPQGRADAPPDIPPAVWHLLQESGQEAATRLLEMLAAERFHSLSGSTRTRLIDIALTRAYGLPVRRSVSVDLTSGDADAVAAALLDLHGALPERAPQGRASGPLDVTPHDDESAS